jgi:PhoPQ-activated pathogenicity-related protein
VIRRRVTWIAAIGALAAFGLQAACGSVGSRREAPRKDKTALDRYVAAADPSYHWEVVRELSGEGCVAHVLKLTSQTWLSSQEVDRTTWSHWLTIVEPETITRDVALLYVRGGVADDPPPETIRPVYARIARATGSVVVDLGMVPNQPLLFAGDADGPRKEDRLIAFGWNKFLSGGQPEWLPRLPMTKSVVRAMDTVTAFLESRRGSRAPSGDAAGSPPRVGRFVVTGASKRGWTTWTTAAVDDRVVAIVPIVIDLLNLESSFRHHFGAYGFWAPAIQSYIDMGVPGWFGTPEMRRLREIEDPYEYRSRLTMPKLLINATGDQFFVPDSSRFYFDDLPGENHLRYVPNADHSMRGTDVEESVLAFFLAIVTGAPRPDISWTFDPDGAIRAHSRGPVAPSGVRLWQATNPKARDFRLETLGPAWHETALEADARGEYVGRVPAPEAGWTAFFVEMTYPGGEGPPLKLTTAVRILPETLPFEFRGR